MGDQSDSDASEWTHLSESSYDMPTFLTSMRRLLVGKVFVGDYAERHYVDYLSTYRDVIVVNTDEVELLKYLAEATRIVVKTYGNSLWFGVTNNEHDGTPKGHCLWVSISQIPLGKHWFQIESVHLDGGEISLKLKHLRLFDTSRSHSGAEKELVSTDTAENFDFQKFFQELKFTEVRDVGLRLLIEACSWCIVNLKNVLTYENIRETVKFCSVLFLVVATFVVEASRFLCDYSLKLIRELSVVIRSLTPITMGVIDFFAKCVGGFYLLLVMLWRGSSGPPIPPNALPAAFNRKAIGYGPQNQKGYQYAQRVPQPRGRFSEY